MKRVILVSGFAAALAFSGRAEEAHFEVASIKPSPLSNQGYIRRLAGGRLETKNVTLRFLLRFAYTMTEDQITGGPKWMDAEGFDIVATPDRDYGNEQTSRDREVRAMLRGLLAERFMLRTHIETRELSGYVLTAGRDGAHMERCPHDLPQQAHEGTNGSLRSMTFESAPTSFIARNISNQVHRLVVDETGLEGKFDCRLEWSPDLQSDDDTGGPSIFTALQQQLGLSLRTKKVRAEVLVVDQAEKPSQD